MKLKRRIWLCLVLLGSLGGISWLLIGTPEQEPVYQDKTLSEWLRYYQVPQAAGGYQLGFLPPGWSDADKAVRAMGTNALPSLLRILSTRDSALKHDLIRLTRRQQLIKVDFVLSSERKLMAQHAFTALGAEAKVAVPALVEIYEHNPDMPSRLIVAEIFRSLGTNASLAVPALLRGATDTNAPVALNVDSIRALVQMRTDHAVIVPVLVQILTSSGSYARVEAADALAAFGADAKSAIPALFAALKGKGDYQPNMNISAALAIRAIDPATATQRQDELDAAINPPKAR